MTNKKDTSKENLTLLKDLDVGISLTEQELVELAAGDACDTDPKHCAADVGGVDGPEDFDTQDL